MPQLVHEPCWRFWLYFPASQLRHGEPVGECVPIGQAKQEEAGGVLDFPASHNEQDTEGDPLYWPALQSVQADDSTPVAALVRYLPEAHGEQVAEAVPPYCPALQLAQAEDSMLVAALARYLPAGQLQMMERSDNRNGAFV